MEEDEYVQAIILATQSFECYKDWLVEYRVDLIYYKGIMNGVETYCN